MKRVRIISATRYSELHFRRYSKLGVALQKISYDPNICISILYQNCMPNGVGLAELFNQYLHPQYEKEILLFVHDDVYIDDFFLSFRLNEAIARYDVIGVAGNRTLPSPEISWVLDRNLADGFYWQAKEKLSGAVAHFNSAGERVSQYGDVPSDCRLIDGCFMAVNAERVLASGARFDKQFKFHFYDLDFCRTCDQNGLKIGTWPIAVTHDSGGAFGSEAWEHACKDYFAKWYPDQPVPHFSDAEQTAPSSIPESSGQCGVSEQRSAVNSNASITNPNFGPISG
ncbi:MAG: hypothetical protein COB04_14985 [Gammaproteobacteria bacterium]|nr:MAG: hypothetical protein COB04_14985 [Gammaproteobacteria bacterium]